MASGPVRKYSIGAVLLDKADPSKVLARSREPLVRPEPSQREGYVPNVVYTCGALRHGDLIILPYAVSDTFSHLRDDQDQLVAREPARLTVAGPGDLIPSAVARRITRSG